MEFLRPPRNGDSPDNRDRRNPKIWTDISIAARYEELARIVDTDALTDHASSEAHSLAWSILRDVGLRNFDMIHKTSAEELRQKLPREVWDPVSFSLATIAWLSYASWPQFYDRVPRMLERAVALSPDNLDFVEQFALAAVAIKPEHLLNLQNYPEKQRGTVIGYQRKAGNCIEVALEERFGITWPMLGEQSGESLNHKLREMSPGDHLYLSRVLSYLASLQARQAEFFWNGKHASHAIAAGCSMLQCLELSRDIVVAVDDMSSWLSGGTPDDIFGSDLPQIVRALEAISSGFHLKWRMFNNPGAAHQSQRIDDFCERLDQAIAMQINSSDAPSNGD
jgi:hypothetical protein